jgi:hypothetical protein
VSALEPGRDGGLEVAVARVGRPGGRARWAAIAWAAALVALVTVAIAERPAESGPAPVAVADVAPGPHADPGPAASEAPRHSRVVRVAAPRERTPGEDGLMGSLVFDFEPDYPFVLWWPVGNLPWLTNPTQS